MDRKTAAEQVEKLLRLAEGSSNPNEVENAKRQVEKLIKKYSLSKTDLQQERLCSVFDDFVERVRRIASSHPAVSGGIFSTLKLPDIIGEIAGKVREVAPTKKIERLRQLAKIINTANLFQVGGPIVSELKAALDSSLKDHNTKL